MSQLLLALGRLEEAKIIIRSIRCLANEDYYQSILLSTGKASIVACIKIAEVIAAKKEEVRDDQKIRELEIDAREGVAELQQLNPFIITGFLNPKIWKLNHSAYVKHWQQFRRFPDVVCQNSADRSDLMRKIADVVLFSLITDLEIGRIYDEVRNFIRSFIE